MDGDTNFTNLHEGSTVRTPTVPDSRFINFVAISVIRVLPYSCNSCRALLSFVSLRLKHRDEMAQLVFDIAGCCDRVSNFFSQ
jgi:hypothetical protein